MEERLSIAVILLLGMAAQWTAWRLRIPGILLLLGFGLFAGPDWLGWLNPEALLGRKLLFALVSASVAIILFEGGLSLRWADFKQYGGIVTRLITVGALVTWILGTLSAHYLAGLEWRLATLLGGILVVSGPTVVLPLLRHINPSGPTGPILMWEGIVIDPIGALLALLVFESFWLPGPAAAAGQGVLAILITLGLGGFGGWLGGRLLAEGLRRYWIPDHLQVAVSLGLVVGLFAACNAVQHESGLLAVTVMGIVAANQRDVSVRHILEFKEHLRVLLISSLFLLLAALVRREDLALIDGRAWAFLAALLLVVRPVSVLLATRGSSLSRAERIFLAWMCPRGIVAAAVASVFGFRLMEAYNAGATHLAGADRLVPLTFLVIVGTVVVYGLTGGPLARRLGLATPNPQGILFVGAHTWARDIATACAKAGITVYLADANRANCRQARLDGLSAWTGDILHAHEDQGPGSQGPDLTGIGRVFALTPNDQVNHLVTQHYRHEFGSSHSYQLARDRLGQAARSQPSQEVRVLFAEDMDFYAISRRYARRAKVRGTTLTEQFNYEAFLAHHEGRILPLLAVDPTGTVRVSTVDRPLKAVSGDTVIALIEEPQAAHTPPETIAASAEDAIEAEGSAT